MENLPTLASKSRHDAESGIEQKQKESFELVLAHRKRHVNRSIKSFCFVFLAAIVIACPSFAKSIWCKSFGVGCPSQAEIDKALASCEVYANQSYREGLSEALADYTVWQHAGETSAQSYATFRRRLGWEACVITSSELEDYR